MKKLNLPFIIESAKKRPLGLNPINHQFVYYDELQSGVSKLIPLNKLDDSSSKKLIIERYRTLDNKTLTSFIDGKNYSINEIINEINNASKVGNAFKTMELNYLNYYLSTFPKSIFACD